MIKANFNAYNSYVTDSLFQWERNQKLEISGLNLAVAPEIHFSNAEMDKAIVRQSVLMKGTVMVDIPNSMLQSGFDINVYIGIYEGETFKVIETVCIPIKPRKKPEDYILEVDDHEVYSFKKLENKLNNLIVHNAETGSNAELLDIRVGSDGKMYPTAGESVRGQYEALDQKIEELNRGGLEMKDETIGKNVTDWLNAHPEATSTVQNESITEEKFTFETQKKKASFYNSVSDMLKDKKLKRGMTAITLGYYTPNDGGGATYIIKEKPSLPNEITILSLKDGKLCAEIQKNEMGYYNVLTLGVERNSGKNVTDRINAILNIMYNETIYFPKGIYDVTSIKIPYPMTFLGSDSALYGGKYSITENDNTNERTILRYCGTGNENMITMTQSVKVLFDGITFYGNSVEYIHDGTILPTVGVGVSQNTEKISLQNVNGFDGQGIIVKHCRFYKFSGYAVKVTGLSTVRECIFDQCTTAILTVWDCVIDNIIIGYGRTGILCKPDNFSGSGGNIISNIRCDGLMGYSIELVNSMRNTITGLIVDQIDKAGICLNNSRDNSFINCNLNRTAKYYAGSSKTDLPNETLGFASAIYFCGELCSGNYIDAHIYQEQFDDDVSHRGVISPSLFVISEAEYTGSNKINITSSQQLITYDKVVGDIENLVSAFNGKFFSPTDIFYINSFKVITQPDNYSGILEINGCIVKSLHDPKYLQPYYVGQILLYKGKYYMGTGVKTGDWKELNLTALS